ADLLPTITQSPVKVLFAFEKTQWYPLYIRLPVATYLHHNRAFRLYDEIEFFNVRRKQMKHTTLKSLSASVVIGVASAAFVLPAHAADEALPVATSVGQILENVQDDQPVSLK